MNPASVTFRFRPTRPVAFVDLRGEMLDWRATHALAPAPGGGWLETSLALAPGVYSYKFRLADGQWALDQENPRTRACDGLRNSVLVVGGAEEPLLHAPVRPWVYVEDDGRLCLRAGLRRGAGERLALRWSEATGARRDSAMRMVAAEDEHLLFECHLPASARTLEYLFVLADGSARGRPGGAGQAFRVARHDLEAHAPAWWREAIVYSVFVDRFRGRSGALGSPAHERGRAGGDLDGIVEALPYLEELGVTALHLTPIVTAPSAHRYDVVDPRAVDPALGGEAALDRLLDAAHARGLRVLLDITVTHVHRDCAAFADVRARGPASPWFRWFRVNAWPFREGPNPGYAHYQKGQWQEPLLDTSYPEVADWLVGTFEHWTRRGADGFRVDAAMDLPLPLLGRIGRAVRRLRPDAALFGEVISENSFRYTADGLDAATDFAASHALHDWLWRTGAGARRTTELLARRRFQRGGAGWTALGFLSSHDQARLATLTSDPRIARLGLLLLLLRPEVPSIYYGDEVGLASRDGGRDFEDAWPDRRPMPWEPAQWDEVTLALTRSAIAARRANRALAMGDEESIDCGDEDVLAFRRRAGDQIVDVFAHRGAGEVDLPLPGGAPAHAEVLVATGVCELDLERGRLRLGPWSGVALRRSVRPATQAAWEALRHGARDLHAAAFAAGALETPAPPVHLYLTVTERCNLACAHCITDAPARTQGGRARTTQRWLLEALAEVLPGVEYVGFAHGGESLVDPGFFDVLAAIRRARRGRPGRTDVHLLSNGMLLDESRVRALLDGGLTSLAVSLDGASAATNDALRIGGRFEQIVANLRGALALRRRLGADLRIGISSVVTAENVAELPALGHLAASLGVDWLKIEELVPATPAARRSLLLLSPAEVAEGMGRLREQLAGSPVVLVEHLDPHSGGCSCGDDVPAALRRFREADDFANRARFVACRLPWEQVCIDPDGVVRQVDYDHPPLGNLLERSFLSLWNGETAQEVRRTALRRCRRTRSSEERRP